MTSTVAGIHLGPDTHANRPAANTAPDGSFYFCTTHSIIYKSNYAGNSWSTWIDIGSLTGSGIPATILDAKGDIIAASAADTAARLAVGSNDTVLLAASGEATGLKWGHPVLSSSQADASAAVTLTADTIADATGCSVSCVAGTWLLIGQIVFTASTASRDYTLGAITTSANVVVSEIRGGVSNAMPESVSLSAIVTPGSTTTYKLRGQSGRTNNTIARYSSGTQIGTRLIALRAA